MFLAIFISLLFSEAYSQKYYPRQSSSSGNECITPLNDPGHCVVIKSCQILMDIITYESNTPEKVQLLRSSLCGYDGKTPKVCCPDFHQDRQPQRTSPIPARSPISQQSTTQPYREPESNNYDGGGGNDSGSSGDQQCGEVTDTSRRIIGGQDAALGDWPWMASLGYHHEQKRNSKPEWFCGGALISDQFVLTAGHCLSGISPYELTVVRLGDLDLDETVEDGASPIDVPVENYHVHEKYSSSPVVNDIAIVKLRNKVQFTDFIKPICLPRGILRRETFENSHGFVAGWGRTKFNGSFSSILQDLRLPIVANEECKRSYSRRPGSLIDRRVLCAGFKEGGMDSCQGDSGGPLVYLDTSASRFYLIGIVSYGYKCAEPGYPGIYTRITEFSDWISNNSKR